jgi:DNA-binding MarR family transcriptional regulator
MVMDPLEGLPGYALRRASALSMAQLARRLEALELRTTEVTVLMVIDANPGVTQSEIGKLLEIASANLAPLAGRLEERNLIARERVDGRSQGLSLSESGKRLTQRAKKAMNEHEASLLAKVPTSQRSAFLSALHAIWKSSDDS